MSFQIGDMVEITNRFLEECSSIRVITRVDPGSGIGTGYYVDFREELKLMVQKLLDERS